MNSSEGNSKGNSDSERSSDSEDYNTIPGTSVIISSNIVTSSSVLVLPNYQKEEELSYLGKIYNYIASFSPF